MSYFKYFRVSFYVLKILLNTVSYLKLNCEPKLNPKMCRFKNLEKFCKKHLVILYFANLELDLVIKYLVTQ